MSLNRRIVGIFFALVLLLGGLIIGARLEVFPCEVFVWDSTQGVYFEFCPLVDEDGYFLLNGDTGGYEPNSSVWTWVALVILFGVVPYFGAVMLNRILNHKK